MILGFDSNVQFISFRFVSRWQWKFRGKFVLVLSFDLYILQRVITDFSRFLLAHLLVPRGVRSKFLWEIVIESPRSYKYAFVSPRETSNKLHNGQDFYSNEQRTARTAMAKHARDLPRDNLLVNQNDAWRYKVTRQRTRLTINFNTRHHQISRRCFPRWLPTDGGAYPSASATVRLMPRSLTTIILEDLGLPISHGRYELLSSS